MKNQIEEKLEEFIPIWDKLKKEEKDALVGRAKIIHYDAHKTIHGEGDGCLGVIFLEKGQLRVYMLSEEGREVTLYRQDAGDVCILSASCILDSISFDVFVDSESEVEGILIDTDIFASIMGKNVYLENYVYQLTSERFSDVMWAMQQVLFMSMDKRLAIYLLDEMSRTKSTCIEATHESIAKYIGSAREVVSRMLKYFEKEGILDANRGGILIKDKEKLRKVIEG